MTGVVKVQYKRVRNGTPVHGTHYEWSQQDRELLWVSEWGGT